MYLKNFEDKNVSYGEIKVNFKVDFKLTDFFRVYLKFVVKKYMNCKGRFLKFFWN